ncbi:hypothetical protein [Pseudomonas fulva]|uniref:hypothetical protein n=1 Tax=Pseudomonas fulva TaxID=47880 RepID=UPI002DB654AB|nr:hypothetical protein [Pseudomonas fulva]MEB8059285.1 hypothetical protein [Pseudomonas fulva]
MKPKPIARFPPRRKQGGFVLPQLAIVMLVGFSLASYAGYRMWRTAVDARQAATATQIGQMLSTVNDATKTYATSFFTQIQRNQAVSRNGYTVPAQRVLNPTIDDLSALGFLPGRSTTPILYNGASISFQIRMQVVKDGGCTVPTCNIKFQVTTTRPMVVAENSSVVDIRRANIAANAASPANAGVSLPSSDGGDPSVFSGNRGVVIGDNPGGVAGLVSIRNGYDSTGFFEFDRRDGSLPRTGDINMQDVSGSRHNINNAGALNAQSTVTGTLEVTGLAVEGQACTKRGLIASNLNGKLLGCNGIVWGKATDMPNAHRYLFTHSTKWTVPQGVKSALVTMAGGGASGVGWRISNGFVTGSSGGFVFSAPINLVPGEVLDIVVGQGGTVFNPYDTGVPVVPVPQYHVWAPPAGDDGLGGYPGGTTKLVSPSAGTLLECSGGSGATIFGVHNFEGDPVAGNVKGAQFGSGIINYITPNRVAQGKYAGEGGGPGACGPNGYGVGNPGVANVAGFAPSPPLNNGQYYGGSSPFGYGSGGGINYQGCYVTRQILGRCAYTLPGRDGVVMIDVLY